MATAKTIRLASCGFIRDEDGAYGGDPEKKSPDKFDKYIHRITLSTSAHGPERPMTLMYIYSHNKPYPLSAQAPIFKTLEWLYDNPGGFKEVIQELLKFDTGLDGSVPVSPKLDFVYSMCLNDSKIKADTSNINVVRRCGAHQLNSFEKGDCIFNNLHIRGDDLDGLEDYLKRDCK